MFDNSGSSRSHRQSGNPIKNDAYTSIIPKGISNVFVSNLFTRSNGGCVAFQHRGINFYKSRWVRRLAREAASSISQTCTFGFFTMFHSFPAPAEFVGPLQSKQLQIRESLHIPAGNRAEVTSSRGSRERARVTHARGVSSHAPCNLQTGESIKSTNY